MRKSPTGTGRNDIQIIFKDSPEAFEIKNARMLIEGSFVRFVVFDGDTYHHDEFYPTMHIHRIKRFAK